MLKIKFPFHKIVLLILVAALMLAALPVTNASAQGLGQTPQPPGEEARLSNERLEEIWVRLQQAYERQGRMMDRADELTARIQAFIDKMNANGKDTSALQSALDAFENALEDAKPLYAEIGAIVRVHAGFDANGKVTDRDQAITTLKNLSSKMKELRQKLSEPAKVLRQAVKAFREANRPPDGSGVRPRPDDK